jgi:hypothetical protein
VTEELARPGSGPTGACFWALGLGCNCSLYSISVSAKVAVWSSATSFEILLLMADCTKSGSGQTKDFSALIPQPYIHASRSLSICFLLFLSFKYLLNIIKLKTLTAFNHY